METLKDYLKNVSGLQIATAAGLAIIWYFSPKLRDKRPPFPWVRLPIVGNIVSMMRFKDKAYQEMYKLSKKPEYDKVFMIKLGGQEICVINHIDLAREALVHNSAHFADRTQFFSGVMATMGGTDILFGNYGPKWRLQKKLMHQAIRNFCSGPKLERIIQKSTNRVLDMLLKQIDSSFVVKPILELLTFNIINGLVFGKEYEFDDPEFEQFMDLTKDFVEAFRNGCLADIFPNLSWIPFQGRGLNKLITKYYDFLKAGYEQHKTTYDPDNLRDMTDFLIHAKHELDAEDADHKELLTDQYIIMIIFDFIGAGLDTINSSLQFIVGEAAAFPDIQQKVADEIKKVLGDRAPSVSDRVNLPYTEAFLCEVLRQDSLLVFSMPLSTTCHTTLGKYELPRGTSVTVNVWAIHHDEEFWENPSEFHPERFLTDSGELNHRPVSFMPFFAGKRVCAGENLAKNILMLVLPMLFQHLKFIKPADFNFGYEDVGFANIPRKFKISVEKRN